MKISLNEIKGMNQCYGTTGDITPNGIDELVQKIGAQLGGVDEVVDFGAKYKGIIVAKIVSCEKHPNADKLKVCLIDDGGKFENVERNENGHVQVVCGAPNAREGILVAWLPPGLTVPASVGKDPLVLEARDFRGQMSNGMLASASELALGDDHSGILEISDDKAKAGDDFAKTFGLDDYIIDIENKMFTHRPDLFGFLGVARELAGIQQMPFKSPDWYKQNPELPKIETEELKLEVRNEIPDLVSRFTAVAMRNVKVGPSPMWLQIFLVKMGQKSINNIVDYTNYFMHLTGQPLHAYDYDKLAKSKTQNAKNMEVRKSRKGDKLKLLNGKEVTFNNDASILITSGDKPIGIGGVMGGSETEVDETTKNIVIECASFDMYSIRRTAMEHGLFTDAVTRFTKGQSALQNPIVLAKIVDEIKQHAGGEQASMVFDIWKEPEEDIVIDVTTHFINDRLGLNLSLDEMTQLLENVEMKVSDEDGSSHPNPGDKDYPVLLVFPPFWRTDLEIPEDIVEEIGRLYGYDKLPLELPKRNIVPSGPDAMLRFKHNLRDILAKYGANEVLTYSFVPGELMEKAGQNKDEAYKISNALSPELQYYRLSLTPSLLSHVHHNVKMGHDNFALFELGKTHSKKQENEDEVPKEIDTLSFIVTKSKNISDTAGSPFYAARRYLDHMAKELGIELVYYPVERDPGLAMTAPFDLNRSSFVTIKDSKGMLGVIGEYNASLHTSLKLPTYSSGFEIGIQELLAHAKNDASYKPLSRYPGTWQDMCFQVSPATSYKEVYQTVTTALSSFSYNTNVEPIDIYQPRTGEFKNITLRIHITNHKSTITAEETKTVMDKIVLAATEQLKAKII